MYIDRNSKGFTLDSRYKADQLILDGGKLAEAKWQENLIGVITNPTFDIAVYCYSEEVFNTLNSGGNGRIMTWITHPQARELANM